MLNYDFSVGSFPIKEKQHQITARITDFKFLTALTSYFKVFAEYFSCVDYLT
jgi:hypothetical protein